MSDFPFSDVGHLTFDGTDDCLSVPDSDDFSFGTGDFTIDFLCYFTETPTNCSFMGQSEGPDFTPKWLLVWNAISAGSITFLFNNNITNSINFSWTPIINTWYHLALVRSGSSWYFFVDGVQTGGTQTNSGTTPNPSSVLTIGRDAENWLSFTGYLSELRISKGIARWTTGFTPPTTRYTADQYTVLLIHGKGDKSCEYNNVSCTGGVKYVSAGPFDGVGSYYFGGTDDYLSIPDSDNFDFGADDFTIDFWLKTSGTSANARGLVGHIETPGQTGWNIHIVANTRQVAFATSGPTVVIQSDTNYTDNVWTHYAIVSNGANIYMYQDGLQVDSDSSGTYNGASGHPLVIGRYYANYDGYYITGYISNFRISKGIARWTTEFTPPSEKYTNEITCSYTEPPAPEGAFTITIVGTGSAMSGVYAESGTYNGLPQYKHATLNYWMSAISPYGGVAYWTLGASDAPPDMPLDWVTNGTYSSPPAGTNLAEWYDFYYTGDSFNLTIL